MNRKRSTIRPGAAPEDLGRVAEALRLLAHPHRLGILRILRARKSAAVHEVSAEIGLAPAATSQHLNAMRRRGLLAAERAGKEVRYRVAEQRALRILDCICKGGGRS